MAQACPSCQWYSPDGVEVCPHCGEPLPEPEPLPEDRPASLAQVVGNWIQFFLGIGVLALFGYVAFNRYGVEIGRALGAVHGGWRNLWSWLLGPEGQYADYVGIAVLASALFWFILWLFNRLNR